ncbi:hypothetical protein [Pedobacter duraquae]|uniref:Uncharacterized protein n=1 Tax=Pedobacter duraquae TaxID=425511 RepID=A0A4R6IR31_9SPHI|nr:hypothetical protein [Pedobacter duraquae]TDO24860.1 hypothetical protein CLV32_1154 [Pedobacter duraquae]
MLELIIALILGLSSPSTGSINTTNNDGTATTNCTTPPPTTPTTPGDGTGGDTGHYPPDKP